MCAIASWVEIGSKLAKKDQGAWHSRRIATILDFRIRTNQLNHHFAVSLKLNYNAKLAFNNKNQDGGDVH
jgi:hypothetical protein